MNEWRGESLWNFDVVNWKKKKKNIRTGWLEKVFRAGEGPQNVVVPIIIIIIIIIIIM
jgi:hypothetical protein